MGVIGALLFAGCGGKTSLISDPVEEDVTPTPSAEVCNGEDDDLDTRVDEAFRDAEGRYVDDGHCGACDAACGDDAVNGDTTHCGLVDGAATCVPSACDAGFALSRGGACVPAWDHLCLACDGNAQCGGVASAACVTLAGAAVCTVGCEAGCPEGYGCTDDHCVPAGGSCACDAGDNFTLACALTTPTGALCPGRAMCDDGVLSDCSAPEETCDGVDNDCDGIADGPYRDARGVYSVDIRNCGACGIDCTANTIPEGDLVCGGDPFAPTCVLACPDAADGVDVGDRVDADRDVATGCECTVGSLVDAPGPVNATGQALDVNCDGADGQITGSFYVAQDGKDTGPGSPSKPFATVSHAVTAAAASAGTNQPRIHVYVAAGTYAEAVSVPDGVQIHGGYRRDFLSLDPQGFRTEVRAPAGSVTPGHAALDVRDAGTKVTVIEGLVAIGGDAEKVSSPSFGVYLRNPGAKLTFRNFEARAGTAGMGNSGQNGAAGARPTTPPSMGEPPRAAVEDAFHGCIAGDVVQGGAGGLNICDGVSVAGGRGGSPSCPKGLGGSQPPGVPVNGGGAGQGGGDAHGPILGVGPACQQAVCCGLSDMEVSATYSGPGDGVGGIGGTAGTAGLGCDNPFGTFSNDAWKPDPATRGSGGKAGYGGGGGGAGGGVAMDWYDGACEFPDGIGGGGGGGGAAGCGGLGGRAGQSGGPSAAMVIRDAKADVFPVLVNVVLRGGEGGRGGDGGVGGDGGLGDPGAYGGDIPFASRTTPTLAGVYPGARGGPGGNGGAGGGGGGGCGGPSVGIWIVGSVTGATTAANAWRGANTFVPGHGGDAGRGGSGAAPAANGLEGSVVDVFIGP